jgi:uncharacterized protein (TIGR02594 family)
MVKGFSLALGLVVSCPLIAPADAKSKHPTPKQSSSFAYATEFTNDGRYYFGPGSSRWEDGGRVTRGSTPVSGSDLVARAERYLGSNPTNQRSLWCSDFMNFITGRAGTGSRAAKSWANWGRPSQGKPGDVVVLSRRGGYHVGVVKNFDSAGNPVVISGNAGGVRGNRVVAVSTYSAGRVVSYRTPS